MCEGGNSGVGGAVMGVIGVMRAMMIMTDKVKREGKGEQGGRGGERLADELRHVPGDVHPGGRVRDGGGDDGVAMGGANGRLGVYG